MELTEKRDFLNKLDEEIMYIAKFVIENRDGEFRHGLEAMNALANAKIALCTKYEESEE